MTVNIDDIIARIDRRLTDAGLFPYGPPSPDEYTRMRVLLTEYIAMVDAVVMERERALLTVIGGNFEACSAELLERAAVMLASAAMGKAAPTVPPDASRVAELERRLERAEAMIQALTGPAVYQTPLVFRWLDGTATRPTTSTGDDEP